MVMGDGSGKLAANSIFGDQLTGIRKPTIVAQFQYGLASDSITSTIVTTGTYVVENSLLKIRSGTSSTGSCIIQSTSYLRYVPGCEAYAMFTAVFTAGVTNSVQYTGLMDSQNGFYIGYNGVDFVIGRRKNGTNYQTVIDKTKVFTDKSFDPNKGNVYKISFGYLGFATINFEVLSPSGQWVNFAKILYPNSQIETHINQTNLPVRAEITNAGNTFNLEVRIGSINAGIVDGGGSEAGVRNFTLEAPTFTATSTGYGRIIAFRNKTTFSGIENRVSALLKLISVSTALGNKACKFKLLKNPTVTGGNWTSVNANDSVLEYSTDTTVGSFTGEAFLAWNLSANTGMPLQDVSMQNLLLKPGGVAVFAATTLGSNTDVDLAIRWAELF